MFRIVLILIGLTSLTVYLADRAEGGMAQRTTEPQHSAEQDTAAAKLTWRNGDALPGQWLSADGDAVDWFAESLFRHPVQIDRRYLQMIEFPIDTTQPAANLLSPSMYLIQGVDGSRLFGEIRGLDQDQWTIFSPRFGEVKLDRGYVAAVQNLANAGQWTAGRFDLNQWDSTRGQKRYWQVNSQGQLLSTRQNIHLYRADELPPSSLIELELSWNKKLDFLFCLGVPQNARQTDQLPRLETWDDSLVFSYGDNFEIVLESFHNPQRRLRVLLHWDQANQKIAVHDPTGRLLCEADLSGLKKPSKAGIYIENKSGDLKVEQLLIRQSQPGFDSTRPSYQQLNLPADNGRIVSFDGQHWTIETAATTAPKGAATAEKGTEEGVAEGTEEGAEEGPERTAQVITLPHAEFSSAFSLNPTTAADPDAVQVEYHDGMYIAGELQSFDGDRLQLLTSAMNEPVKLRIAGARQIQFPSGKQPDDDTFTHQMFNLVGTMRGRLEPGSQTDGDIVQWRLPGASRSVSFASAQAKIVLQKRKLAGDLAEAWGDTLYFYNRDRIPCRVLSINEGVVHFDSFTEQKQVDSSLLKAIDLESAYVQANVSPQDSHWIIPEKSRDAVGLKDDQIEVSNAATFSHADLLRTGGFEFEIAWQPSTYGSLELELFGDPRLDRSGSVKLTIYFYDNQVMVQSPGNERNRQQLIVNHKARVRLRLEEGNIKVMVGNRQLLVQPLANESPQGTGVKWTFNQVTQNKFDCRISQVQRWVSSERGETTMVATEQKELLLTIPRLRKNNPPQHILRANNGDMLRGELLAMDQDGVQFKANHEVLRFSRSLVSALIWLHFQANETDQASQSSENGEAVGANDGTNDGTNDGGMERVALAQGEAGLQDRGQWFNGAVLADGHDLQTPPTRQTVQVLVSGNRRLTYDLTAWRDDQLVGRSAALGECVIPMEQIEELRFGSFANQALDVPYSDWMARLAPEPQMLTGEGGGQRSEMLFGTRSPLIGTELPDLSLKMLEGDSIDLKSLAGKVVVLDFWATWCSPCVRAMPDLISATGEFSTEDVLFLAVNQEEDAGTIETFLAGRDWSVQIGLDNGTLARRMQVQSLPQTIVVAPDGKIAFVKVGYSRDLRESLHRAITSLLAD